MLPLQLQFIATSRLHQMFDHLFPAAFKATVLALRKVVLKLLLFDHYDVATYSSFRVWQKFIDVSEIFAATIIRAISKLCDNSTNQKAKGGALRKRITSSLSM
jgi:hypothetical protein